jgi:alpha-beta hydrolase superfamily lysophospholipase
MSTVTSSDGTAIAFERAGSGPAVVLVGGGVSDRAENAPLAAELAKRFTVVNYDRRGRGASGDTPPYAVERELEDIAALVAEAGPPVHLYGVSSGGALVLEAAVAGIAVDRLAVYEVPWDVDPGWPPRWRAYVDELGALLADGCRGAAFALFMRLTDTPDEVIASARDSPMWAGLEAVAHTLAYDAAVLGDGQPPAARLATIAQPTLVATGEAARDPAAARWVKALDPAADAIAASIPRAERRVIEGQGHVADPKAVAAVLEAFFA